LDLAPRDKPLGAGTVAHDHPLVGQFADFDHLAVVAEDGLAVTQATRLRRFRHCE
jgi:hypothetical protein